MRAGELAQGEDEVPAVADGPPQDEALPSQAGRAGVVALRPGHVRQAVQGVGHAPGVPQPPAQRQGLVVVATGGGPAALLQGDVPQADQGEGHRVVVARRPREAAERVQRDGHPHGVGGATPQGEGLRVQPLRPRLFGALIAFWYLRGTASEARQRLDGLLALPGSPDTPWRVKAGNTGAVIAWGQGDATASAGYARAALVLGRAIGDRRGAAYARIVLAAGAAGADGAEDLSASSVLAEARAAGEVWLEAFALTCLGLSAAGRGLDAVPLLERGLDAFRATGDPWGVAEAAVEPGQILLDQRRPRRRRRAAAKRSRPTAPSATAGASSVVSSDRPGRPGRPGRPAHSARRTSPCAPSTRPGPP